MVAVHINLPLLMLLVITISYYIDNVSLIPTNGAELNLPESICNAQNLNDLSIYLSGTTSNGNFSGNGVTFC